MAVLTHILHGLLPLPGHHMVQGGMIHDVIIVAIQGLG